MSNFPVLRLIGKTIQSVEVIQAEYGRTYHQYTCFVCTDGTKLMVYDGHDMPHDPHPEVDEMRNAPNFYSPQDIADEVLRREQANRKRLANQRSQKEAEFDRLKKELGR